MNKEISAAEPHVENGSEQHKTASPGQRSSVKSAQKGVHPLPQTQQETRSDQEQEGTQNPAGDTRDVNREPVEHVENLTKKKK